HLPTVAAAYDRRRSRGKALSAVYGGVNKLESSIFPSLHHRKEGWPSESQNIAKLPLIARPGWFSDRKAKGKPPRLRLLYLRLRAIALALRRWLRNILLTTQPPLLAVMQGGKWLDCNSFTAVTKAKLWCRNQATIYCAFILHFERVAHECLHRPPLQRESPTSPYNPSPTQLQTHLNLPR